MLNVFLDLTDTTLYANFDHNMSDIRLRTKMEIYIAQGFL